ncbi:uncharacterized protein LOC119687053 [Teleopsis dalmanni]|uniref:uncharacterized protein LOC119687053 n=1 Tax=Teleopsis dalmanni TaxID=139649 RepID=UPI000D32A93A|nr:uncharacterized protein LOC119687053 [Teleopsis dalmanni]
MDEAQTTTDQEAPEDKKDSAEYLKGNIELLALIKLAIRKLLQNTPIFPQIYLNQLLKTMENSPEAIRQVESYMLHYTEEGGTLDAAIDNFLKIVEVKASPQINLEKVD